MAQQTYAVSSSRWSHPSLIRWSYPSLHLLSFSQCHHDVPSASRHSNPRAAGRDGTMEAQPTVGLEPSDGGVVRWRPFVGARGCYGSRSFGISDSNEDPSHREQSPTTSWLPVEHGVHRCGRDRDEGQDSVCPRESSPRCTVRVGSESDTTVQQLGIALGFRGLPGSPQPFHGLSAWSNIDLNIDLLTIVFE